MRMQVILDSSFARPGSAPIWGGKKGEFRDWTTGRSNIFCLTVAPRGFLYITNVALNGIAYHGRASNGTGISSRSFSFP